jgi:probable HAF family extracellular repeat protein
VAGGYYNYDSTVGGIYRHDESTGTTVDLGNFGLSKIRATSINDRGDIAGTYDPGGFNSGVFPFRVLANGQLTLIPTLGGAFIYDVYVNSSGAVAGSSSLPSGANIINRTHAFLFKDGVTSDIDLLNSEYSLVHGINDSGDVVGQFVATNTQVWQSTVGNAFFYHNGVMHDLGSLLDASGDGWVFWHATGINNNGWIVGEGWFHGPYHLEPFLAVPTPGSPAGTQTRFANVSTRLRTSTGDDALIAGFVLRGGPKRLILRALGPGLGNAVPDRLADPTLELFNDRGERLAFNDNFTDLPYSPDQSEISSYRLSPPWSGGTTTDSVIAATLPEGAYTAVVRGKDGTSGNCLVEVYNVDTDYSPGLLNISTRGPVCTGDNVMIAGFIISGDRQRRVLVRGIGPSLAQAGVANPLQDPMLEIHDQDEQIATNDDWRSAQEAEILAAGFAPGDDRDAAVILSLWPGSYTAIVRGKANGTGNALVEVYALP